MGISIEKARVMNYFSNTNLLLKNNNSYDSNVLNLQSDLTTLGYSTNGIDGYFGDNTKAAVTAFQNDYGLDADGIAGSQTLGKINELIKGATSVAATPTPVYDSVSISGLIQMGSKGSAVTDLQEKLIRMGYNCGGYGADGDFGTGTYNSVVQFQKNNGLTQDGIVGTQTSQAIANALKTGNNGVPNYIMNKINTSSTVTSTANKVTSYSNDNLSKSMVNVYNSEVEKLQRDLTSFGYSTNGVDGYFGENTEAAVRKFQQDNHLSVDGIAGQKTKTALYNIITTGSSNPASGTTFSIYKSSASGSAWSSMISGGSASGTGSSTPSGGYSKIVLSKIMANSYNSEVEKLQKDLTSLGYYTNGIDGYFGDNTYSAVRKFQESCGLKQDGIVGEITKREIGVQLETTSNITGKYMIDATLLQQDSRGIQVTILQERLKALKLFSGVVTGQFDSLTEFAVKQFQMNYSVTGDKLGVAGTNTINKINGINEPVDITKKLHELMEKYDKEYSWLKTQNVAVRMGIFYSLVKTNGPVDLKNLPEWKNTRFKFEDEIIDNDVPGNILYGYVGKVMGFDDITLCAGAGIYQIKSGTSEPKWINLDSWGDDPRDQEAIRRGIQEYNESH